MAPSPSPVTISPPKEPVVLRTMPLAPPLAEMLRNRSPLAPMIELVIESAKALVVAMVLTTAAPDPHSDVSQTFTVPSPRTRSRSCPTRGSATCRHGT